MKILRVKFPRAVGSRFEALGVLRSNRDPTEREYFTRNYSYKNSFKQCKIFLSRQIAI